MATQPESFLRDPRNPLFTGREAVLQNLYEMLNDHQLVALSGPGGIGKTAVALEYAYRFSPRYQWIFWLDASSSETLLADMSELVSRLTLPIATGQQNLASLNEALQTWLVDHQESLLILDNINGISLPPTVGQATGHTLVLTRKPIGDPSIAHVNLGKLDAEHGALLILRQAGQMPAGAPLEQVPEEVRSTAIILAREMDGLPLAMKLAGAYIRITDSSVQDYLAMYHEYTARLVQFKASKGSFIDAIAITCSLPVIYIRKTQPIAAELLWLCTILSPIDIPRELFTQGASELTPTLQGITQTPSLLDEALAFLCSFELLVVHEITGALSMQPTVQETLCQAQTVGEQRSLITQTLRAFFLLLPSQEQATLTACMRKVVHVLHLATLISDWIIPHELIAQVFCWAASFLWEQGLIQDAEMLLRKALMIWELMLGTDYPALDAVLRNLATLNALLKNYAEAETFLQNALLAYARTSGATHPDTILCLIDLASIYAEQGKTGEARVCYQEALKIGGPALGEGHALLVIAVHKLALISVEEEKFEEAEIYYQRIFPIYEAMLGAEDSTTQACLEQMAAVYFQQQKFAQAEEALQRLLAVKERTQGIEHPETNALLQKVALVALVQGKLTEAEDAYQRLHTFYERMPGQEAAKARQCQEQLASIYLQQGRFAEAESAFRRALQEST